MDLGTTRDGAARLSREGVLFRDGYVCHVCGVNVRDVERAYYAVEAQIYAAHHARCRDLPMDVQRIASAQQCAGQLKALRARLVWLGYSEARSFAEVHHVVALEEGGDHSDANRVCACQPCHKRLTRELNARLRRRLTKRVLRRGEDRRGRMVMR